MAQTERAHFGRLGVILVTAGSAVGLGNIWRFPYMTGQDGGAAFILIYIGCVLLLGIPGMAAEFIVGRRGAANAVRSYSKVGGKRAWGLVGLMGVITSMIILGFYAVVAGWCLQYLFASVLGHTGGDVASIQQYFSSFSSSVLAPILWAIAFVLITHLVVTRGVRKGIERASNLFMPLLFILLLVLVVASCSLPGAWTGVKFLFHPDFSRLTGGIMLDALGQAFFSLSLGTACLCTYASYFNKQTHLLQSATQIALIDTLIAVLAGLMIFPAAFSVGVQPDSGPSLIFITLPNVFTKAFGSVPVISYVVSILFYALLSLAALTSTISMHEIGTVFFHEEMHLSRSAAAVVETVVCCVLAVFCSLSVGAVPGIKIGDMSMMDFCDNLTSNILLPSGSFLTCILIGWVVPHGFVKDEFTNGYQVAHRFYGVWIFMVRFVCPLLILAIFLHRMGVF